MVSTSSLTQHAGPRSLQDPSDLASDSSAHSGSQHRQCIGGAEATAPASAPVAQSTVKHPGNQGYYGCRRINLTIDDITIEPAALGAVDGEHGRLHSHRYVGAQVTPSLKRFRT
jgi:hypothetical protein